MIEAVPVVLEYSKTTTNGSHVLVGTTVYRLRDVETQKWYRRQFLYCESANLVASILNERFLRAPFRKIDELINNFHEEFAAATNALSDIEPLNVRPEYY